MRDSYVTAANKVELEVGGVRQDKLPNAKVPAQLLRPNDRVMVRGGGGGGFGSAIKRPAAKVCDDVVQGYVSVEAARRDYGVVVDPVTLALDVSATEKLRAGMQREKRAA